MTDDPGKQKTSEWLLWGVISSGDIWAMATCAAVTLAIEIGGYELARSCGTGERESLLAVLAAATMWVAVASGPMAAGGQCNLLAALRGAAPADATLVAMLVLMAVARGDDGQGPWLTVASVLEAYCVLAAMAVFSIAAVCCGRMATGRCSLAVGTSAVLAAAVADPFWTTGVVHAMAYRSAGTFVAWAIRANPFYSVTGAMAGRMGFFWHEWGLVYDRVGAFRDYAPPPVEWWASAAIYGGLAAVLGAVALLRRSRENQLPMK